MLVICEDCAKKYNIDESLIKGDKARFSCQECGHIIVVKKPEKQEPSPKDNEQSVDAKPMTDEEAMAKLAEMDDPTPASSSASKPAAKTATAPAASRGKGTPIGVSIFLALIIGFVTVAGAFAYLYLKYVPEIINNQIELRTQALSQSFSGVIKKPLLLRNYLQVNKEAKRTSKLPGVAYAAVVNKKGIVIAGFFSDLDRFDKQFAAQVKKKGFPPEILAQNKLQPGVDEGHAVLTVGGQQIHDEAVAIPDTGGEVHVGIYISEVNDAIHNALVSPLTMTVAGIIVLVGFLIFIFLTRSITRPMRELTDVANRISLGEMDLAVKPRGPREMRELAVAFERMRFSIKAAMERLRK
jgi:HAMP domain-containing protein/DNA-directed RNA polymerase subunit RPC12/RpoP